MKNKRQNSRIEFKLSGINTEQFAVLEDSYEEEKEINLSLGLQFSTNAKEKSIGVHFSIQFEQDTVVFLKLKTVCFFLIDPEKWSQLLLDDTKRIKFPKGFVEHLSVITVGTTRGILFEKLNNEAQFRQLILPTINVTEIVKEDVIIDL